MNWDVDLPIVNDDLIILPFSFSRQLVAIEISATNQRSTWYRSGYLRPLISVEGNLALGLSQTLTFGLQLVEIPFRNYKLQFDPHDWLENTRIKIKQLDRNIYN